MSDRFYALLRRSHCIVPDLLHLRMIIPLPGELFRIRVVSERRDSGIGDHDGLEVKPTIAEVSVERHGAELGLMGCISQTWTYISASTSFNRGAVHPRISPGERGFDRGMVVSYFPLENVGPALDSSPTSPFSSL